ncbi:MAG: SynChlorMet cassette radical SAM/SPASM protein ScmE [Syntrophales bacterium]
MAAPVMHTPRNVDIEITSFCNLHCAYCSHFSGPGDVKEDLPLEAWLQFFSELGRCNTMKVTLSGGEPFSRPDLRAIILAIVTNRMRFTILSNGTLIDNEMAAFLAETGRCDLVQVSIDGAIDTTHDAFRGEGNFMKAIRGIHALQANRLPVSVRVTIHRRNVLELEAIAEFLLEDLELPSFSTNSASHMGLCRKNAALTQLTVEEHSLAMETLLALAARYKGRINASAGPLADAQFWLEMEHCRRENRERPAGRGFLTGCSGPMQTIAIRADGVIVPCSQLSHLTLGRINQDDLGEIWRHHQSLEHLRNRSRISLSDFSFCQDCPYTSYCTGNCPAIAYSLTGKIDHPSPDACLRKFLIQGGRLPGVSCTYES